MPREVLFKFQDVRHVCSKKQFARLNQYTQRTENAKSYCDGSSSQANVCPCNEFASFCHQLGVLSKTSSSASSMVCESRLAKLTDGRGSALFRRTNIPPKRNCKLVDLVFWLSFMIPSVPLAGELLRNDSARRSARNKSGRCYISNKI